MACDEFPDRGYRVPDDQRNKLRIVVGDLVEGELPDKYKEMRPIITVGDVVTETLLKQGIKPDIAVIDLKTRRGSYDTDIPEDTKVLEVTNPMGTITSDSWHAMKDAMVYDEPVVIKVDGEEDLLSIIAIIQCPPGGTVIYGMPGKGMVINIVDQEKKDICREAINDMIKIE